MIRPFGALSLGGLNQKVSAEQVAAALIESQQQLGSQALNNPLLIQPAKKLGIVVGSLKERIARAQEGSLLYSFKLLIPKNPNLPRKGPTDDEIAKALLESGGVRSQAAIKLSMPRVKLIQRIQAAEEDSILASFKRRHIVGSSVPIDDKFKGGKQ
jgi:hypothetical protein